MTEAPSDDRGRLRRFHEKYIVEVRTMPASARRNLYIIAIVLAVVGLVAFLVILDSVREGDGVSVIDKPIQGWLEGMRSPTLTVVMGVVATVFGPIAPARHRPRDGRVVGVRIQARLATAAARGWNGRRR